MIIDNSGIQWRSATNRNLQRMAWADVRAFLRSSVAVSPSSSLITTQTKYYLVGSSEMFEWEISSNPNVKMLIDSDRLSRYIIALAGLPLRDASLFIQELGLAQKNLPQLIVSRGLAANIPAELLQPALKVSQPKFRPWQTLGGLVLLLLTLIPFIAGGWVQHYNDTYMTTAPQHLPSATPLFRDALSQDNGSWPTAPISANNDFGYTFTGGAYELHGTQPGDTEMAFPNNKPIFGSAVYAVTVVESGQVPDKENDSIGLVLHSDAQYSDYITFSVTYSGEWRIYHHHEYGPNDPDNWEYIDSDYSSAINQGPNVANRLMIITYSDHIVLFINGHYMQQVKQSSYNRVDFSRTGEAGIYLNISTMTGDFSDFEVDPAPPIEFWDVVKSLIGW